MRIKSEQREKQRNKKRYGMAVNGRSVFLILDETGKRAKGKKRRNKNRR